MGMLNEQHGVYNVNIGVLGHVDSGKTSLVASMSTALSTAALDKHPQSKERGITLDLGFSSFTVPMPEHLQQLPGQILQFTLVDCPGHASLIRTIIGGAQIIDMMILVVDVTKGIQAQTAECLVVGEIATRHLCVVLNKIDLLPQDTRQRLIAKAKKRLAQTLAATTFAGCPMVAVSAKPGGGIGPGKAAVGVAALIEQLVNMVPAKPRQAKGAFLFAVDHCFALKGQGTVLTGTVLSGATQVGDTVELPQVRVQKKIKSMQVFRRPVQSCQQGDRAGLCVTQLDAKLVERGIVCAPGSVPTFSAAIAAVERVRFYSGKLPSSGKVHVTLGHTTVMAEAQYFGLPDSGSQSPAAALASTVARIGQLALNESTSRFDFSQEYAHQSELHGMEGQPWPFGEGVHHGPQWAFLVFSQPVTAPADALVIGSRLEVDASTAMCRLAFYGRLAALLEHSDPEQMRRVRIFKVKRRSGSIDRVDRDGLGAVCKGMFKKETDISVFAGLKVITQAGDIGRIEGSFGKSGKFRVSFQTAISPPKPGANGITLTFKRFIHDANKKALRQ